MSNENRPKFRGFGSMSKERLKEITSAGGRAAQAGGRAHRWTSEEAKEAGRKGRRAPKTRKAAAVAGEQ